MLEFINKLLTELTGFDLWFAAILFAIGLAGWYYLGQTKKAERETAKRQLLFAGLIAVIGISGIAVHHLLFEPNYTFPKEAVGILVLRIEGDDKENSLQRDLVSSLNTELGRESPGQKIEVRSYDEVVTEAKGLSAAHKKARKIGREGNAKLVIWGTQVGENKFHPRITIVDDLPRTVITGDRAMAVQILGELKLPAELVDEPILLTHFITGYGFFDQKDYSSALLHFDAAREHSAADSTTRNDLGFYAGTIHLLLAQGHKEMGWHLQEAVNYYEAVADFYKDKNSVHL